MKMQTQKIITSNGLNLWTESLGDKSNPACLLISGAGASAKFWSDDFCQQLVDADFFVIRFDHRDQNLSDAVDWDTHAYTVKDLAEDAIRILDAYHIQQAHVVGHSMGGIVAQLLAIYYPERVLSYTSMSVATVGKTGIPPKEVMDVLLENKPTQNFANNLPGFMKSWRVLSGTFAVDEVKARVYTQDLYIRSKHPVGVAWNHIRSQESLGDLSKELATVKVSGLFIHGELDPLMPVQGAKETAKITPHSQLIIIPGMGHMFFNKELEKEIAGYLIQHFKSER